MKAAPHHRPSLAAAGLSRMVLTVLSAIALVAGCRAIPASTTTPDRDDPGGFVVEVRMREGAAKPIIFVIENGKRTETKLTSADHKSYPLRDLVRAYCAGHPNLPVILTADGQSPFSKMSEVMSECLGGSDRGLTLSFEGQRVAMPIWPNEPVGPPTRIDLKIAVRKGSSGEAQYEFSTGGPWVDAAGYKSEIVSRMQRYRAAGIVPESVDVVFQTPLGAEDPGFGAVFMACAECSHLGIVRIDFTWPGTISPGEASADRRWGGRIPFQGLGVDPLKQAALDEDPTSFPTSGSNAPTTGPTTRANTAQSVLFTPDDTAQRIVFLCDGSGSMINKWPALKADLGKAVLGLKANQSFEIIFFRDNKFDSFMSFEHKDALVAVTPESRAEVSRFLESVTMSGTTDEIPGIEAAFKAHPQLIYLLTDGDFADNDAVLKKIRDLNNALPADSRAKINTVAFVGMGDSDVIFLDLLKTIAKETGGTFRLVKESDL